MIIAVARRRLVLVQLGCFKHPVTVCLLNPRKFRKSFGHVDTRPRCVYGQKYEAGYFSVHSRRIGNQMDQEVLQYRPKYR